jgi:simple sugar transport system permease protein
MKPKETSHPSPSNSINVQLDRLVGALRQSSGSSLFGLTFLLFAMFVVFSIVMPNEFLQSGTMQSMMFQLPELGLLSLAMAIPLVSGGLNLAIISTTNQAALLMAWILTTQLQPDSTDAEMWTWVVIAMTSGFVLCLLIGLVTGFFVAVVGAHPILVTLGTQTLLGGINIWLTRGKTISGFPDAIIAISNDTILGVPISFALFIVIAAGIHFLLTRTTLGIQIHMIGSNLESTRFSGVNTRRTQICVYVLSSLLCWLAAIVMMGRFNSAGADIAQSYLLITILAAILGGIDPYGGFGKITGLLVALLILQTISSGFNLLGFSQHLTLALWGLTLVAVIGAKRFAPNLTGLRRTRLHS